VVKTLLAAFLALILWALTANAATAPQPIINFGTSAPSIPSTTSSGTVLSSILVTLNTGGTFTGTIALTNSAGGVCARSSPTLPSNLTVGGATLVTGNYTCTVSATQGGNTTAKNITITVKSAAPPVPMLTLGSATPSVIYATIVGTPLSTVAVTMSDGSKFTGTLGFGAPNSNDGGICALSSATVPSNVILGKALALGMPVQHCTVVATQGIQTSSANISITVTGGDPPVVVFGTPAPAIQSTAPIGTTLSNINVTNSDGSVFTGNITFGTPYTNGGGACALAGVGTTLVAPTTNTLVDSDGTWSFGPGPPNQYGYPVLLNGVVQAVQSILLLSYNGHTYHENLPGTQYSGWYEWNGSLWPPVSGDPRPPATVALGETLTAGTYNCTVVATQGAASGSANIQITVTGPAASPMVVLTSSMSITTILAPGIQTTTPVGTTLAHIAAVTMSDGSPFTGTVALGGTYGNGGGACTLASNSVALGETLTAGTYNCTVVATQGAASGSANIQIVVNAAVTPTITLGTPAPSIAGSTSVGTPLSTIAVSMSDSSTFSGTLQLAGTYGNGGGACALSNTTLPANVTLGKILADGGPYNCTVVATQGVATSSVNIAITVTGVISSVSLNPPALTIQDSTAVGANLSYITVTNSDGSPFTGTVALGGTYGNGGGACVLVGTSVTLAAPTTNTLVDSDGSWSFGSGPPNQYGYPVLLNGVVQPFQAMLLLSYNGHTYNENLPGTEFSGWYEWNGSSWLFLSTGDPRPPGSGAVALGKMLTAGPYNCTVVTQ
jgi:acetolactate synthase regulatory subunit